MGSNCLNVRVSGVTLGNVTGDAIHKAFAPKGDRENGYYIRADISKNHFYTDLSMHKANSPLTIGTISENVMCDNVFGTSLRYCVSLSTADNCIISNSSLSVTQGTYYDTIYKKDINPNSCIRVEDASKCWIQNSYLYYDGEHRKALDVFNDESAISRAYNRTLSVNKKHRRNYIGPNFDINNYMLKFTGCDIVSTYGATNYYFEPLMRGNETDWLKIAVTEYWDNCAFETGTGENLFRLKCINDLPTGLTIRNSYFHNSIVYGDAKAPFRFECAINHCACCKENETCYWNSKNKRFPWLHIENVVLDNAGYWLTTDLTHIISVITATDFSEQRAVDISGSYAANSYKIGNGNLSSINNYIS